MKRTFELIAKNIAEGPKFTGCSIDKDIYNEKCSFDMKLKNGAECNLNGGTLKCTRDIYVNQDKSTSQESIEVENIRLSNASNSKQGNWKLTFKIPEEENMKVSYDTKYVAPGTEGSVSIDSELKIDNKGVLKGLSNVKIEGFSSNEEENNTFFYFPDIYKGKMQSVIRQITELGVPVLKIKNSESKLDIQNSKLTSKNIDSENKSGTLEYDDTYQVRYYTEPYSDGHNLEINII
ncbi:hypothetical protein Wcon_00088 [Wolbachia endosymbiont of Cylisticus convexus]|uniref:hypothetical protein n=1 Tax=Wolbachia endosymbiont of Cylisticus convexus TaxID=118728 RepID=UPI000DF7191E|nr:hypothetical protein [Wolbachia endosymbiont of Cylisticus convexus]RDD35675.1 hypothetical protein Wcon_00088 [Wolbachia endosymbiont of Cylisticus convexus]